MAGTAEIKIALTDEITTALEKVSIELKEAREAVSEERIRQIMREELATWEKSLVHRMRVQGSI